MSLLQWLQSGPTHLYYHSNLLAGFLDYIPVSFQIILHVGLSDLMKTYNRYHYFSQNLSFRANFSHYYFQTVTLIYLIIAQLSEHTSYCFLHHSHCLNHIYFLIFLICLKLALISEPLSLLFLLSGNSCFLFPDKDQQKHTYVQSWVYQLSGRTHTTENLRTSQQQGGKRVLQQHLNLFGVILKENLRKLDLFLSEFFPETQVTYN